MVQLLLKHGADPSVKTSEGLLPIHAAAANSSYLLASQLAGKGSLLFITDPEGESTLQKALASGPKALSDLLGEDLVNATDTQGSTPIHYTAENGQLENLEQLIANGADINIRNRKNQLPLDLALSFTSSDKHVKIAERLIRTYSDIPADQQFYYAYQALSNTGAESRFEQGFTVLHYAALHNHPALLELFIRKGARLDARDETNQAPIHVSITHGNYNIAKQLIQAGADADARNGSGSTPLHLAVQSENSLEIISFLLTNGADIDSLNLNGDSPLHLAAEPGTDPKTVSLLLSSGANPDSRDRIGNTPIMLALAKNNRPAVENLLLYQADLYARNYNEITPMIRALMKGLPVVEWFYKPSMNETIDVTGNTPLHIAVMNGADIAVVQFIIKAGAAPNRKNLLGDTALHTAVAANFADAAVMLITYGADPFLPNNQGKSPTVLAFEKGTTAASWIITTENLEHKDSNGNTPLHMAAAWDFPEITSYLINQGADTNQHNREGLTPLHSAVKNNSIKVCQILTNNGAEIDSRDSYGNTPLHTAINWEASQTAKFLLLRGADVRLRNLSGNTPLHTAVLQRDEESVKMLAEFGAMLEARDNMGMTPLILAARRNYWEISELLISLGADYNTRDNRGNTPLHEAVRNRNKQICQLLIKQGAAVFAENRYGDTPIGLAFQAGLEVADWFLGTPSISARDDKGNTLLHTAIQQNASEQIISLLIQKQVDIDSRNNLINTPLHTAFISLNKKAVLILVEAGADIFSLNGEGSSPLSMAIAMGTEALSWIITAENMTSADSYGNSPLHIAAASGSLEAISYLLSLGIPAEIRNLAGDTPVDAAEKQGHKEAAVLLQLSDQ